MSPKLREWRAQPFLPILGDRAVLKRKKNVLLDYALEILWHIKDEGWMSQIHSVIGKIPYTLWLLILVHLALIACCL